MDFISISTLVVSLGTLAFLLIEYSRKRSIEKIDFFLKFRMRLKEDESLIKITRFITDCEQDPGLCERIPDDITVYDFYYFLGFIEELSFVYKHDVVTLDMIDDMFGFYILAVAENLNLWNKFEEDADHYGWKNFNDLAIKIQDRRKTLVVNNGIK